MTGDQGNTRATLRRLSAAVVAVALGAAILVVAHPVASASALSNSRQDQVEAWLEDHGDRAVKEVLLTDADWAGQLGLTSESHVSFGSPHRYVAVGVPDYDLATDTVQGDLTIEAHILREVDYCVPVRIDYEPVALSLCMNTEGDAIEMTSLGQSGFTRDVSAISADVDFIDDGPYGIFAYESGNVVPLEETAKYHVPEPTPAPVFMEARAKRAAEHDAASSVDGMMLGSGPSLLDPDSEELAEWNTMVAAGIEAKEPTESSWSTALWVLGGLAAAGLAGALVAVGIRARNSSKEGS